MLRSFLLLLFAFAVSAGAPAFAQDGRDLRKKRRKAICAKALPEATPMVKHRQFANANAKLDVLLTQRPREPQARLPSRSVVQTEARCSKDAGRHSRPSLSAERGLSELPEPVPPISPSSMRKKGEYEGAPHRARIGSEGFARLGA